MHARPAPSSTPALRPWPSHTFLSELQRSSWFAACMQDLPHDPLLHFTLDPRTHQFISLRIAKVILVCSQPVACKVCSIWWKACLRNIALWIIEPPVPGHHQLTLQTGTGMHGVPVLHECTSSVESTAFTVLWAYVQLVIFVNDMNIKQRLSWQLSN